MMDRHRSVFTQYNNVINNLNVLWAMHDMVPDAHLVKLGTMGEYGTPNIDIEEGWIDLGTTAGLTGSVPPAPAWVVLSPVQGARLHNIEFCCRMWDMRATDLNQGVVYGQQTTETERDARLATRFDYDEICGTALNRFSLQAVIGHPLTAYGEGGQSRGFIDIRDTLRCVELACVNPADRGEFRVFNRLTESCRSSSSPSSSRRPARSTLTIEYRANPRVELPEHYYNVKHTKLVHLGLEPHLLSETLVESLFEVTKRYAHRVRLEALRPTVKWRDPTAG